MAFISSFSGYRPPKALAVKVASRPYDVLNRTEAKAESNPQSFLRIIRSEIDLPDSVGVYEPEVYATARKNFDAFVADNILVKDAKDCLYVYAQTMNGKQQIGLVAGTSIDDYQKDVIKKHEFTRPAKEKDRIAHIGTTRLQTGPVLMAYPQVDAIDEVINKVIKETPTYDFVSEDGIGHTFWVIEEDATIDQLVGLFNVEVPAIYIADGHHRAASSTKVGMRLRKKTANTTGKEPFNFFLSVLFPDNQLQIIDYNRVVKDLNDLSVETFLEKVAKHFDIQEQKSLHKPQETHEFGMYLDKKWYCLKAKDHTKVSRDSVDSLDISILSNYLLAPTLGIKDQRTDNRIDFVGGIRGLEELERRVDSGEMRLAFAIYPVSIAQLIHVADSGRVMPPKSTWFEPKLRSGLVVREI